MENTTSTPWWQRSVIYQIYPRSFKDTTGNGIGDLQGIIEKLDYLNDGTPASLGVEVIWISPFFPSPMADFGYDVSDYKNIHPDLGDLSVFDQLVSEAHKRGIRVIIDYVPNHTSDQHPWFLSSRSSRQNPDRNWYIWRDPKPDGSPPNNWGSIFGGSAWEWDNHTEQYYFHQFLKEQPDLNWRNPDVQSAMFDVLRFWLERGVDGFRMDVVGMIFKHVDMPDQPEDPNAVPNLPANDLYSGQLHIYDQDQEEVYMMAKEFRRFVDSYGEKCLVGEVLWYGFDRWLRYYGQNGDGLHLPFYFRLLSTPWKAHEIRAAVDEVEEKIKDIGWPNYVLGNHDRSRLASRYGPEQARVAAMLLLTLRGTPTLYYGDELGMENADIPCHQIQDPWGINLGPERNRDVSRSPMQWDDSLNAGFSNVKPWLPVSADFRLRNVAEQSMIPSSMLNLYKQLIWYRKESKVLTLGNYRPVNSDNRTYCFLRIHENHQNFIALNFTNSEKQVVLPGAGRVVISTYLDRQVEVSEKINLRPNEGIIIELN